METQEDPAKQKQLVEDIALLDKLLGVEARKPGKAASLPAAIRIVETFEPAGGKQIPVFPASYAGATDQSPPVYDLMGIEYGEGEDTVRIKNGTTKIPRIISAKMCAIDSPQSQANRMEPAFLECEDLQTVIPQAQAVIPRLEQGAESSVLNLPHRVADFRVRLSDRASEISTAIAAFSKGDCLPLIRTFPTSLIFGFWNSRGEDEQGVKHARILLARIDATDVVPCRRHSLYSGPYSKDEFGQAVLQRDITKEEAEKLSKEGFSAAPSEGLGGVLVSGSIERLSLLSLTDIGRLNCKVPDQASGGDADNAEPPLPWSTAEELSNAARRYIFALAALAEGHDRSKGSHRLRSGCELVAVETNESKTGLRFEFRGSKPENAEALQKLYFDRPRLIAIAKNGMTVLRIQPDAGSFIVTAQTLAGKIVPADQAAKGLLAAEKAASDAMKKADEAEKKAGEPNATSRNKTAATNARKKAVELTAKAKELAAKLGAAASSQAATSTTAGMSADPKPSA